MDDGDMIELEVYKEEEERQKGGRNRGIKKR